MASLADELMADLGGSDVEEESSSDREEVSQSGNEMIVDESDHKDESIQDIRSVSKLLHNQQTQDVFKKIEHFKSKTQTTTSLVPSETDEEYRLIVDSNTLTADIDNEIQLVHKFIRDHYAAKFPELESLVLNPLDYAKTVKTIGNETDITKVDLRSILPSATVMVISITGTTTSGKPLSPAEWKVTEEACDMAIDLEAARKNIMSYVESRMTIIAPNLTAVVGSSTAAKLITAAGGLSAFCRIPSCNVQVIGNNRKAQTHLSKAGVERHTGFVYYSDIVNSARSDIRRKVAKIVAAKCALAARSDLSREHMDGSLGRKWLEEIKQKIEKLEEPAPSKSVKALPVPDDGPKKRRGGRRLKRQREAYAMTELRMARNRMTFGEAEEEVGYGDSSEGLGMVTKQIGKIRASNIDLRTKVKGPKNKLARLSSDTTSGLATSLKIDAAGSIEFGDPSLQKDKTKKLDEKYFGDGAFSIIRR